MLFDKFFELCSSLNGSQKYYPLSRLTDCVNETMKIIEMFQLKVSYKPMRFSFTEVGQRLQ